MSYKHTQGEWNVENKSGALGIYSEKYNGSYLAHSADGVIDDGYCTKEEQEANMKLMASAPKLLEALEVLKLIVLQTDTNYTYNGKVICKSDILKHIATSITNATTV